MALFVLTDAIVWAHDLDVTGNTNKVTLKTTSDDKEANVFGMAGYKQRVAGFESVELAVAGYADTTAVPDSSIFAGLGVLDRVITVAPASVAGSVGYLLQGTQFTYEQLGAAGDVSPFSFTAKGSNKLGLARGQLALPKQVVSGTGAFAGVNLGNSVGKLLFASLHVFGTPGTTVTVAVEAGTSNSFPVPHLQATIGPITTGGGSFIVPVSLLVTDPWFRFNVTAITGSFVMGGAIGVR